MEVLIDPGLLKYYTHTVFKYQPFTIIVYFKGDKVIIEWTLYNKKIILFQKRFISDKKKMNKSNRFGEKARSWTLRSYRTSVGTIWASH